MNTNQQSSKSGSNGGAAGTEAAQASKSGAQAGAKDAREKLMDDMKNVIEEAESWLADSAAHSGEQLREVKEKFDATLQTAKSDLLKIEASALARTKLAAKATDAYVQEHPWQSLGLGAAIGVVFGLLISRK